MVPYHDVCDCTSLAPGGLNVVSPSRRFAPREFSQPLVVHGVEGVRKALGVECPDATTAALDVATATEPNNTTRTTNVTTATEANKAIPATNMTTATEANKANPAPNVTTATEANKAISATNMTTATEANKAISTTNVTTATEANEAQTTKAKSPYVNGKLSPCTNLRL